MKKRIVLLITIVSLIALAGCAKDKPDTEQSGEITGGVTEGKAENQFVSQDYEQGNCSNYMPRELMRTGNGFYHYNFANGSYHYYDVSSGKEMYLCNKPECRHDGNQFCVATNETYEILGSCLYNGKIVAYALEITETQNIFKLLTIAPDGSSMDEMVTVLTLENSGDRMYYGGTGMQIHRNKALITFGGSGIGEDTWHYGAAIVDLNTKEVTFLNEEAFSKENLGITEVSAYGDHFYYCQKEGKKKLLRRYHLETGTIETCKLLTNFSGDYVVLSEDCVVYLRSSRSVLCTYRFSTGENEEKIKLQGTQNWYENGTKDPIGEIEMGYEGRDLLTDGTYVYVPESIRQTYVEDENGENVLWTESAKIHVFDKNLEEIITVNLAKQLPIEGFEEMEWHITSYTCGLRYLGEDIYWCLVPYENPEMETYVFHCKRDAFLTGEPEFTFVYKYSES